MTQPIQTALRRALGAAADALLPPRCRLCREICARGFCRRCQTLLPWIQCACRICARALPRPGVCGACQARAPHYCASVIPFRYAEPIARAIHRFKYAGDLTYAKPLGELLAAHARATATRPDVIVPVPLHANRLRQRGFNQALQLARVVARELQIPLARAKLHRIIDTPPQAGLKRDARIKNMRRAFAANDMHECKHVALIDDVVTTGGSVNAAAHALKKAGAKRVEVWALSKT